MAYPKLMQYLFQNSGAGPLLRVEIGPWLSKSGGTLDNGISFSSGGAISFPDTGRIYSLNGYSARLMGGHDTSDGAYAILYNQDSSISDKGRFVIGANDGSHSAKELIGKGDGTLTWNGTAVALASDLSPYALASSLSVYMPLAGGTMSGPIIRNGTLAQGPSGNAGAIRLFAGGDEDATSGAKLYLYGVSHAQEGAFLLQAGNSNSYRQLRGKPSGELTWSGSFTASSTVKGSSFQATSDLRKKSDLEVVAPDLSALKAYRYTFAPDGQKHIGLIAQEVEKVMPEAVSEGDDGFKRLEYSAVVAALVSKVNELEQRLAVLEGKSR